MSERPPTTPLEVVLLCCFAICAAVMLAFGAYVALTTTKDGAPKADAVKSADSKTAPAVPAVVSREKKRARKAQKQARREQRRG